MPVARIIADHNYCNVAQVHRGLAGVTPVERAGVPSPLPLRWINMVGSSTAGACFRSRSPLHYEFATNRCERFFPLLWRTPLVEFAPFDLGGGPDPRLELR